MTRRPEPSDYYSQPYGYDLTAEAVAERLGVTARRVRQIEAGELPYLQLGSRGPRRYRADDVERYLVLRIVGRVAEPIP